MKTMISIGVMMVVPLKLIARMEANSTLQIVPLVKNIRPNPVKIIRYLDTVAMVKNVNSLMGIMNLILLIVEISIRPKNVKTFGRKAFAYMELGVNFYILNVKCDQVNPDRTNT